MHFSRSRVSLEYVVERNNKNIYKENEFNIHRNQCNFNKNIFFSKTSPLHIQLKLKFKLSLI